MEYKKVYRNTKTYGHEVGLSAVFRQHKAESHCRFVHGYSLAFQFEFETQELDIRNWCVDYGSMKSLKQMLQDTFDHKTVVAYDDPAIDWFREGHKKGIIDLVEVPACGCEKFAEMVYEAAEVWLLDNGFSPRCKLIEVTVSEHGGNSSSFRKTTENEELFLVVGGKKSSID